MRVDANLTNVDPEAGARRADGAADRQDDPRPDPAATSASRRTRWRTATSAAPSTPATPSARCSGTGIAVPPLSTYAPKLWDYWERNLDPDLFRERSLANVDRGQADPDHRRVERASASRPRCKIGEAGGEVILVSRTREKLEEVAKQVEERGGTAHVHPADLSDLEDIERMAKEVIEEHGGVDILINNAGRSIRRSVERVLRPLPRLRAHDAAELLRRAEADHGLPARDARAQERATSSTSRRSACRPTRRASRAYVASKSALDAFSRCVGAGGASATT